MKLALLIAATAIVPGLWGLAVAKLFSRFWPVRASSSRRNEGDAGLHFQI